jgi:hypothetical protein
VTTLDAPSSDLGTSQLPTARGPLSESVLEYVTGRSARLWSQRGEALLDDPDAQLALWLLNCVDAAMAADVDVERVRSLPLRALHWTLERSFEHEVQRAVTAVPADAALEGLLDDLLRSPAVDLAATAARHGARAVEEVFLAKAPYLGFEADPHTLALARLESPLKTAMAEVQAGEYGVGHGQTHAEIYRSCLAALGTSYRDAVEAAPTASFAFANLAWLFGRDVRWRGAAVGQLCLLELDSVEPCRAQVRAWDAVGLPQAARRWYDVHVLADAEHERIIRERLIPEIESATPWLVADAAFGAAATWVLQQHVVQDLVEGWPGR